MMRTVGVEEELLLVDKESGRPRSVATRILEQGRRSHGGDLGGSLDREFQQQQLETDTPPETDMGQLEVEIRNWRDTAIAEAREVGARVVASGTSPMPVEPHMVREPRYDEIARRFGLTASEHLTCGCHIHVSVDSDDEAIAVLDRIRIWLPSILAVSANSPFLQGADTQYASYRSQALTRWPSIGPYDVFGSSEAYRRLAARMVETEVLVDEGMLYFDARLSHRYPTVEVRVADVCLDARDTVLIAALTRGLVETASREWRAGVPPLDEPTAILRLAMWQASRYGAEGALLDPVAATPRPAREVVDQFLDFVGPVLRELGDEELVGRRLAEIWARGTGARRQRQVLERTGQLADVVADLARVTAGQDG